jgi:hypothetical protein
MMPDTPSVLGTELAGVLHEVVQQSIEEPRGIFAHRWVTPSPFYAEIGGQWLWDAAYVAWAIARVGGDLDTARGIVRNIVETAVVDGPDAGMLLHNPRADGQSLALTLGTSQTPMIAWLAARLHELSADVAFVRAVYPALSAHVRWWRSPRRDVDGDGLSEYAGPHYKAALHESGLDVAPLRDLLLLDPPQRSADGLVHDVVADVGLNSFLHAECVALADLAEAVAPEEAAGWRAEAASLAATMRRRMWCPDVGAFMSVVRADLDPDQPWVTHLTPHVLLPVWAGVATDEQAAATVALVRGDWRDFPLAEGRAVFRLGMDLSVGHGVTVVTDALRPRVDGIHRGLGVTADKDGWHGRVDMPLLTLEWPADRAVADEWFTRISVAVDGEGDVGVELQTGAGQAYFATSTATARTVVFGDVTGPPRQPLHGLTRLSLRVLSAQARVSTVTLTWARQRPRGLLGPYGVRSLHPLDGKFARGSAPTHFWSGTVWPPYAWHTCHALAAAGELALALEQSRAFRVGVRAAFRQGSVAPEHVCDTSGVGMGTQRQAWTAAVALLLEEELP